MSFYEFGNVSRPPSPARPGWCPVPTGSREKRRLRATLSREGRGLDYSIPVLLSSHNPLPSRASRERVPEERVRVRGPTPTTREVAYVSVLPKGSTKHACWTFLLAMPA